MTNPYAGGKNLSATKSPGGTRLDDRLTALETADTTLDTRVDALEAADLVLDGRVDDLETEDGLLDGRIGVLEDQAWASVTVTIGFADLTDSDGAQSFDIGAELPANAVVFAHDIDVTAGFTDGASGVFTLDIGVAGTLDAIADGAALASIAKLAGPFGVRSQGIFGGEQLVATVLADVNVDTATAGSVTITVFYAVI